MKKTIISLLAALLASTAIFAQTPQEIIARMDQETNRFDKEGLSVTMELKLPLLGSFSTDIQMLGDKYKMTADIKGNKAINWSDSVTDWQYDVQKNEITISRSKPSEKSDPENNMKMLDSVTEGYDVKLKSETDQAWYFVCTKSKSNTKKDDPKRMDLVISKTTYLPISVQAKEKGVTITMRNFAVGVKEKDITFNPADYPSAKIIDNR